MSFEETELGLKQSGGVHGDIPQPKESTRGNDSGQSDSKLSKKVKPRPGTSAGDSSSKPKPTRDSLPPTWTGPSSSLDSRPPERLPIGRSGNGDQKDGQGDGNHEQDREEGKGRTLRDEREVMKNGQWVQQRRSVLFPSTTHPQQKE